MQFRPNSIKIFWSSIILMLLFCSTLLAALNSETQLIYVSPSIESEGTGEETSPYGSIQDAIDHVANDQSSVSGYTILLNDGKYFLNHSLEISSSVNAGSERSLTIQAINPRKVYLLGGRIIPAKTLIKNGHIYTAHLNQLIPSIQTIIDLNQEQMDTGKLEGFYVNRHRFHLSRHPNTGWLFIEKNDARSSSCFDYHSPFLAQHLNNYPFINWPESEKNVFLYGPMGKQKYYDTHVNISDMRSSFVCRNDAIGGEGHTDKHRFIVKNLKGALDADNEYYIDRENNILSFYTMETPHEVAISTLTSPIISIENAKNISIEGLVLEYTSGSAVYVANSDHISISNSIIRNISGNGLVFEQTTNSGVFESVIYNIDFTGIAMTGGSREDLKKSGNYIVSNEIFKTSLRRFFLNQAIITKGCGTKIAKNHIYSIAGTGIRYEGNLHRIEYNHIHNTGTEADDVGAIYTGTWDWANLGNVVRYNYIHDLYPAYVGTQSTSQSAIYLDDFSTGDTIYGNRVENVAKGVHIGGGSYNTIINNVFINTKVTIHLDSRDDRFDKPTCTYKKSTKNCYDYLKDNADALIYGEKWLDRFPDFEIIPEMKTNLPGNTKPTQNTSNLFLGNSFNYRDKSAVLYNGTRRYNTNTKAYYEGQLLEGTQNSSYSSKFLAKRFLLQSRSSNWAPPKDATIHTFMIDAFPTDWNPEALHIQVNSTENLNGLLKVNENYYSISGYTSTVNLPVSEYDSQSELKFTLYFQSPQNFSVNHWFDDYVGEATEPTSSFFNGNIPVNCLCQSGCNDPQSIAGNFDTKEAVCFKLKDVQGWNASNTAGREVYINGQKHPLLEGNSIPNRNDPASDDGYLYLWFSAGEYPWASLSSW